MRAILSEKGQLTNGVVKQIVAERHAGEMTAEGLGQMLSTVEENLSKFSNLASESSASASDYGEALQAKVKDMGGNAAPDQVVSALIGLTRSMVEKVPPDRGGDAREPEEDPRPAAESGAGAQGGGASRCK